MNPIAFMVVVNVFYSVVLFSAAFATTGLLAGACFAAGALTVFSSFGLIVGYASNPRRRK